MKKEELNKYVIHIPHSSLEVPKYFKKYLTYSYEKFQKENIFICDYLVDKFVPNNFNNIIKFKYSRMYLNVERYLDDNKEEMSKYGMGVLYTKDSNGKIFVKRNKENNEYIINDYYKEHHKKLDTMVGKIIDKHGTCFIIDLHSFSDEFVYKMFNKKNNPDICIGINKDNYDSNLVVKTISHFKRYGYSVKINYPYEGAITSNKYPLVKSIMIEINKRVYLKDKKIFDNFYNCMMDYYEMLSRE